MPGGNKVFFTVGGKGKKPDEDFRHTSPKRFTKGTRGTKPLVGHYTRLNKSLANNKIRPMTKEEIEELERQYAS